MNTWQRFKKWALAPDTTSQVEVVEEPAYDTSANDHMIGEPVRSFLERVKATPGRFLVKPAKVKPDSIYYWMDPVNFVEMIDRKTGDVYMAYVTPDRRGNPHPSGWQLYGVYSLPFKLNAWELDAIYRALYNSRDKAKARKERMEVSKSRRVQAAKLAAEKAARLEFAKRFQEV